MPYFVAQFPGVQQVISCTYTLSHGIQPGVATMECVPQAGFIGAGGLLRLIDLDSPTTVIDFPNCKVDKHSLRTSADGRVWMFAILDRRWKWRFGWISGRYNFKFHEGPPRLDPAHEKTPRELATLLLDEMGEVGYDVSQLPNSSRPEVDWDYVNPAKALADLVENLGCRVVLQLDNTVKIALVGSGTVLPAGVGLHGPLEDSLTIDPPERPDSILVVGTVRYQVDLDLEPVGLDTDDQIRHIDDLSYRPATGWSDKAPPPDFHELKVTVSEKAQECAVQSVYRWYRVKVTSDFPSQGTGVLVSSLAQILPIYDTQVAEYTDQDTGKVRKRPGLVFGTFADEDLGYDNLGPIADYALDYEIDTEHAIVRFADYVFKWTPDGTSYVIEPASLKLRVAIGVRHPDLWAWLRYERLAVYPGAALGTGPLVLNHPEIQLEFINGAVQNLAAVQQEADYYIAGADQEYQTPLPQERSYPGLVAINPDGAILQVTWRVGSSGIASTAASRNTEHSNVVHPYPMRRVWDYLRGGGIKEIQDAVDRLQQSKEQGR